MRLGRACMLEAQFDHILNKIEEEKSNLASYLRFGQKLEDKHGPYLLDLIKIYFRICCTLYIEDL